MNDWSSELSCFTLQSAYTLHIFSLFLIQNCIEGVLAKTERYKYKLAALPQTPRPKPLQVTADADAIGTLINFCEQRGWPMPK